MPKNIVICADGTGNAFAKRASNVSRLVKLLALDNPEAQIVSYDQGIGTHPDLGRAVRRFAKCLNPLRPALTVLGEPCKPDWMPKWVAKVLGLALGFGLKDNVLQMYQALSQNWDPGDKVFLFGFSRGAFTVRAVAGLVYRCGLLRKEFAQEKIKSCSFQTAYRLYEPFDIHGPEIARFRAGYGRPEECEIHFLGLWDTVKAYGGIRPRRLRHLRHNPLVKTVRHALALEERRAWFVPTSWGGIDGEDLEKLNVEPDERYATQDVKEMWFSGCHSDVGGGDDEEKTAAFPLHWMLREAVAAGMKLEGNSDQVLTELHTSAETRTHKSRTFWFALSDYIPHLELDNSVGPAKFRLKAGATGGRNIRLFARGGKVFVHESARHGSQFASVEFVS